MSDDAQVRLVDIRRSFEKAGIKWDANVPVHMLMAVTQNLIDLLGAAEKRIAALEKQAAGMQKAVDHHTKHALIFRGEWQEAESYSAGCVVRHRGAVFTALKDINPGKAEPGRQGSGWSLII